MNRQEVFAQLQRGDIFATTNPSLIGQLHKSLFRPRTTRFHYGILGEYILKDDDFTIFESIAKGTAVGRLSWYLNEDVEVYRVVGPDYIGVLASLEATNMGRRRYDFRLLGVIAWKSLLAMVGHLWREGEVYVDYCDLRPIGGLDLLCTELVHECFKPYFPVIDERFLATPANFKQSVLDGKLVTVAKWKPDKGPIPTLVLNMAGGAYPLLAKRPGLILRILIWGERFPGRFPKQWQWLLRKTGRI